MEIFAAEPEKNMTGKQAGECETYAIINNGKRYLSKKAALAVLGISTFALYSYRKKGNLCSVRKGKNYWYDEEQIRSYGKINKINEVARELGISCSQIKKWDGIEKQGFKLSRNPVCRQYVHINSLALLRQLAEKYKSENPLNNREKELEKRIEAASRAKKLLRERKGREKMAFRIDSRQPLMPKIEPSKLMIRLYELINQLCSGRNISQLYGNKKLKKDLEIILSNCDASIENINFLSDRHQNLIFDSQSCIEDLFLPDEEREEFRILMKSLLRIIKNGRIETSDLNSEDKEAIAKLRTIFSSFSRAY